MKSIIDHNNLWATDYRYLNDSQEMSDGYKILSELLNCHNHSALNSLCDAIDMDLIVRNEYINPYILSFCSTNDLLSQWRA